MADDRRTHRSHVSYIYKSRGYYGAQGYPQAYQWAYHQEVPFAALEKPLAESRIGLVTTSFFERKVAVAGGGTKEPYAARCDDALGGLYNKDLFWDKDNTHTDDLDTYLPINRLREFAARGRIGSLADRFYGVPTDYSHRRTSRRDAPQILEFARQDELDAVVLVPL
jgi:hypothetical protein